MSNEPDKYFEKVAKGQGHQKILNYFREVVDSQSFQEFIKRTKLKYKIPENGFTDSTKMYLFPPKGWVFENNEGKQTELENEIEEICKKCSLHFLDDSTIKTYLFYGVIDFPVPEMSNMCFAVDLSEKPISKKIKKSDDSNFPIVIRISPYASERDILDYVKTTYKDVIYRLQKKHKIEEVEVGKFRKKNSEIAKRNTFIYENRHLPMMEIMRLVNKEFKINIDYGLVGKIISNERKRRKEV